MASVMANTANIGPEGILPSSYGWHSPRISFSRDMEEEADKLPSAKASPPKSCHELSMSKDFIDFEFRLNDPVTMLPADELFANGKLLPLHAPPATPSKVKESVQEDPALPDAVKARRTEGVTATPSAVCDPYAFSPRAPSCSSRWRELLGLKRVHNAKTSTAMAPSPPAKGANPRSLKQLFHRNHRSGRVNVAEEPGLVTLPLLRDSDYDIISASSSRFSLSSSSSSSTDRDDVPRYSLDSDLKLPRIRLVRARVDQTSNGVVRSSRSPVRRSPAAVEGASRCMSVDSPRMISSGKIVFQGLERSSSSPGSFNGGPRARIRGMDRSYSANVRVTPVLNVPVCSLRTTAVSASVFGLDKLFPQQRKDRDGAAPAAAAAANSAGRSQLSAVRTRIIKCDKLAAPIVSKE